MLIRTWGTPRDFDFRPKPHWELGEDLNIIDFERGSKVTGARFSFYKGLGARLERAVFSFMLDLHTTEHQYVEVFPPFIVNRDSMVGTGQLPKFAEDMFKLEGPIITSSPLRRCGYQPLPQRDSGRGRSTHQALRLQRVFPGRSRCGRTGHPGLIRQHQFNKVELVKFCRPQESYDELETLTQNAERVLQLLGTALPGDVVVHRRHGLFLGQNL